MFFLKCDSAGWRLTMIPGSFRSSRKSRREGFEYTTCAAINMFINIIRLANPLSVKDLKLYISLSVKFNYYNQL